MREEPDHAGSSLEIFDGRSTSRSTRHAQLPWRARAEGQALSFPTHSAPCTKSLRNSIASPSLREAARGRHNAVVVISDKTRPVPNKLLLPPILAEIEAAGVPRDAITILIATGIHRPNEGEELVRLVGADITGRYRIANHFSKRDEDMVRAGTIMGDTPVS